MGTLLQSFIAHMHRCEVAKNEYELSKKCVAELFEQITTELKCDETILKNMEMYFDHDRSIEKLMIIASIKGNLEMVALCLQNNAIDLYYESFRFAVAGAHADILNLLLNHINYPCQVVINAYLRSNAQHQFDISKILITHIKRRRLHMPFWSI